MDNKWIAVFFSVQILCLLFIVGSFIAWFRLRETPRGDVTCSIVASISAGLLFASIMLLGPLGCFAGIVGLPGVIVYFWFMGLRRSRRQQIRIRQWGRKHGYKVITVERQYTPNQRSGPLRSRAELRISARRLSDGQFLVGWVFDTAAGFDVVWDPIPTRHVGPGLHVPNPPHAEPPGASKE
jgi:hypothetical protein